MTTIDFEKIADIFEKSPAYVKNFLLSQEVGLLISEIAEKYELTEEQYYELTDQVGYIALGLSSNSNLHENLIKAEIKENKTTEICKEVEDKVLPLLEMSKTEEKVNNKSLVNENKAKELVQKREVDLKNRIGEISSKYGLENSKFDKLTEISLRALANNITKETLEDEIVGSLLVSRILAEQISADLEKRVFEYALTLNNKKNTDATSEQKTATPQQILPGDEMAHVEPVTPRKEIDVPMYATQTQGSSITTEPVQKPLNVPRFTAAPLGESTFTKPVEIPKKVQTLNIIESKLNKITPGMTDAPKEETRMPTTKYTVDPYREPLQ